ncbi:MAG: hypothetical protein V3T43_06200 [Nitrosomonadaceae bacterium]
MFEFASNNEFFITTLVFLAAGWARFEFTRKDHNKRIAKLEEDIDGIGKIREDVTELTTDMKWVREALIEIKETIKT